jgi:rod shape-determining protein MreC
MKKIFPPKPLLLLILILLLAIVLPPVFKTFLRLSFYEFQAPLWVTSSYLEDLQEFWSKRNHSKEELIEACRDLARRNAVTELNRLEVKRLREEIRRLESLFNLPSHPKYKYEVARVVHREINSWWHQFTIRKGKNYNIQQGAPVIFSGGVVGRIKEVHAYTSIVELVSSRHFRMTAQFEDDYRPVTYQGAGGIAFAPPQGIVSIVQRDLVIKPSRPRRLISSNLGGVFPDGFIIGNVKKLNMEADDLFQSGRVILDKRLLSLKEIAVLIPLKSNPNH